MKNILLSTGLAAALGVFAAGSAGAAPIATHGTVFAPTGATDVACRTVTKTTYRNGMKRSVTSRKCGRDDDRGYSERRVYRSGGDRYSERRVYRSRDRDYDRPRGPGFSINVR